MSLPFPLAVCIGGVFCCSLLALHLLWLATLHRRSRPTVVRGEWDFAATLAGLGGFLVVGVPVAANVGQAWFVSFQAQSLDKAWSQVVNLPVVQLVSTGTYGAAVAAAAAVGFWNRRDSLEVHNIDLAAVPAVAAEAAAMIGLGVSPAITWTLRPGAGHATIRVRLLDPAATAELLEALAAGLAVAPTPATSAGGRYTAAACGLLGCTLALFFTFFRNARMI